MPTVKTQIKILCFLSKFLFYWPGEKNLLFVRTDFYFLRSRFIYPSSGLSFFSRVRFWFSRLRFRFLSRVYVGSDISPVSGQDISPVLGLDLPAQVWFFIQGLCRFRYFSGFRLGYFSRVRYRLSRPRFGFLFRVYVGSDISPVSGQDISPGFWSR